MLKLFSSFFPKQPVCDIQLDIKFQSKILVFLFAGLYLSKD